MKKVHVLIQTMNTRPIIMNIYSNELMTINDQEDADASRKYDDAEE